MGPFPALFLKRSRKGNFARISGSVTFMLFPALLLHKKKLEKTITEPQLTKTSSRETDAQIEKLSMVKPEDLLLSKS